MQVSQSSVVPTGKLREVPIFNSVNWSVSNGFQKSASFQLNNPDEVLTTSERSDKAWFRGVKTSAESHVAPYVTSISKMYDTHKEVLNLKYKNSLERAKDLDLTDPDFIYGVKQLPVYSHTSGEDISLYLVPMQRVWIVSKTEGLGLETTQGKDRYNVWAGILTGFNETFGSEGDSTITVNAKGLSRFLELTDVFSHFRLLEYQGNLYDKYASILNENLFNKFTGTELLGNLKPSSFATLPVFLANFFYTQSGNDINYDLESINLGKGTDFFLHEPIWKLNTDSATCWQQIIEGDSSMAIGKVGPYKQGGLDTLEDLWAGSTVRVWQMLPSVYIDPLILAMFEEDSVVSIMQKQLKGSFELADNNMINCKDMLTKAAQAIMASAYEDDFGNIMFEIPPFWSAPDKKGNFNMDEKYSNSTFGVFMEDIDHNLDYIISDTDLYGINKNFDESNIVTYVETPSNFQYEINTGEVVERIYLTGRVSSDDVENVELQRRFGVRLETTVPIITNAINLGLEDREQFKKALDQFAWTCQQLRNYSAFASSIDTNFLHWLQVNRNVLLFYDSAIWFITDKTLSFNREGGAISCSFTLTMRHRINERLGYPFLDLYIDEGL